MFGFGVCVTSNGKPVHTFADEEGAQRFIEANGQKEYKLTHMGRTLWHSIEGATLPAMAAVHLVV